MGRVLVVDDEPQLARAIALVLSDDHEVTLATDADDGLARIARGERYDVILCDVMMPVISGAAFHARLHELAPAAAARIVFMTGGALLPEVRRFLDRVPNVCLEKPFDPEALRAFVGQRVRDERARARSAPEAATGPAARVLVADDDEAARVVVASVLGAGGYDVVCVGDGDEALAAMRAEPLPSLVLLDLMMPRTSGWQVLAAMEESPRLACVPVVVLTGFGAQDGLPYGRHVLHKPIDPAVLLDLVAAVLVEDQRIAWSLREPPTDLLPRRAGQKGARGRPGDK